MHEMKAVMRLVLLASLASLDYAAAEETDIVSRAFTPPDFAKLTLVSPRLSELSVADEAAITIHTRGCFGGSVFRFVFRGPIPLKAVVSGAEQPVAIADLPQIGEITLSSDDVLRLDR